jgi:ATP-dependent RNA helicase RhlE
MSFETLGLAPELLRAVLEEGYTQPTPIQLSAIPVVLAGKDMMAAAQTGTGKTAAFTLPLLQRLTSYANTSASPARHPIRALILTPTRELADQVYESVVRYSRYTPLRALAVFGGVDINGQVKPLREGVEVLVATPGRLLDHIQQKTVLLNQVELLVLDEADRMLDMGFIQDIRRIMELLPTKRQTLLFSATFSPLIKNLAETFMSEPEIVEVARQNMASESITQLVHSIETHQKPLLLKHLIQQHEMRQVIVFCKTKHSAENVLRELVRSNIPAEAIHGDRSQQARIATLTAFKEGQVRVLVATDVAARGLDIEELPFVINFELSPNPEDYVHRIGRTGRAGATGMAITLISPHEVKLLAAIRKLTKQSLDIVPADGFSPDVPENLLPRPSLARTRQPTRRLTTEAVGSKLLSRSVLLGGLAQHPTPQPVITALGKANKVLPALLLPPPVSVQSEPIA